MNGNDIWGLGVYFLAVLRGGGVPVPNPQPERIMIAQLGRAWAWRRIPKLLRELRLCLWLVAVCSLRLLRSA